MISINVPNVITIAAISIGAYALVKAGSKMVGFNPAWL